MNRFAQLARYGDLCTLIEKIGFIPLFSCVIPGFSVEELTVANPWWSDDIEHDPWQWRQRVATEGNIAYGKFFNNKAGFISRSWYPLFVAYRRNGLDFAERKAAGMSSRPCSVIMDILESGEQFFTYELKGIGGFGRNGMGGFEGALTKLQMETYVTMRGFEPRHNRNGEEYGWAVGICSCSERLFSKEIAMSGAYGQTEAKEKLRDHLISLIPSITKIQADRLIAL